MTLSLMALSLRKIEHDYGLGPVLQGISLEVPAGDFLLVIGANGAGKSTLLRIAAGLLAPRRGEALLGKDAASSLSRTEIARRVAWVPQESSMSFPFRVIEAVLMGRHPHLGAWQFEGRADREQAREALARVGLAGFEQRLFGELSGGERQRVVLARAIAQQAPLLLLDEPTAFLDLRHQAAIYDILADLNEAGSTIVAVTHDPNLAGIYCKRVLAMREGRVRALGSPGEVLRRELLEEIYEAKLDAIPRGAGRPPLFIPCSRRGGPIGTERAMRAGSAPGADA